MRYVLNKMDYPNKNHDIVTVPDSSIVGSAANIYETDEHKLREKGFPILNEESTK
jgi:hypothetical protein